MNPLHLHWIIPLSGSVGFLMAAIMAVTSKGDNHEKLD